MRPMLKWSWISAMVRSGGAEAPPPREHLVEDEPPHGRLDELAVCPGVAGAYAGAEVKVAHIVGHLGLVEAAVYALEGAVAVGRAELALGAVPDVGQVVAAGGDVQGGRHPRLAIGGEQEVLGGEHDLARLR